MSPVQLPRPLEAYFAHAEVAPTRQGRRFSITLPYFEDGRLDRLQWWWSVPAARERAGGEKVLAVLREEAVARFRTHIERWLVNAGRRLHGGEPFPLLEALAPPVAPDAEAPPAAADPAAVPGWVDPQRVANG